MKPIVKITRILPEQRGVATVVTAPAHHGGTHGQRVRLDNVSDSKMRNAPKAHDPMDVIDRACFRFVKNTRAPK